MGTREPGIHRPKVFGVGFHKTGTTSLRIALTTLGYRVTGPNGTRDPDIARNALPLGVELSQRYDGFQDNPWPLIYREMDELHPGSRFILTERPTESWIASVVNHFGTRDTAMRTWIYGVGHPLGNEQLYVDRYERHNRDVMEYFADRPGDLLVLRLSEGDGWEELSAFLDLPAPDGPFPTANTVEAREQAKRRSRSLVGRIRQRGSRARLLRRGRRR